MIAKSEMFWRPDEQVDAAKRLPGWVEFHKACGRAGMFFDHIEREGKRGPYKAQALTTRRTDAGGYKFILLGDGTGRTPVAAIADAHERSGRATDETRAALAVLIDGPPVVDPLAAMLGTPTEAPTIDPLEGMFG